MKRGKKLYILLLIFVTLVVSTMYFSYAFFTNKKEEHGKLNIVAGTLDYKIVGEEIEDNQIIVEKNTTKEIKLVITSLNPIDSKYELYYIGNEQVEVGYVEPEVNTKGEIKSLKSKEVTIYIRNNTSTSQIVILGVEGGLWNNDLVLVKGKSIPKIKIEIYKEPILNGTDPVLSDNLVPVIIDDSGKVRKADIYDKWYRYEEKKWANAVVLENPDIKYKDNEEIPEENIESYFVWIPKYSYQLWDLGNYNSLTSIDSSKVHAIPIRFGIENTSDSNTSECTTPGYNEVTKVYNSSNVSGVSGNCKIGDYMTHPAFLAFDSNGIWVGKFETGYNGANSTSTAQVNSSDSSKIVIKPNVYSWRNITVGNAFEASYNYLRENESHVMKNTEWGAVAYLTSSNYGRCENGSCSEVRINNNSNFITGYAGTEEPTLGYNKGISIAGNRIEGTTLGKDGTYTKNYLNPFSIIASTTGNYGGIYDIGGTSEYVMGYTTGASTVGGESGITTIHSDFFTNPNWNKYYDKYSSTINTNYSNRILGDVTGEIGPFGSELDPYNSNTGKSSWYRNHVYFVNSSNSWFLRGGNWSDGSSAGTFAFTGHLGGATNHLSFRIVLIPRIIAKK